MCQLRGRVVDERDAEGAAGQFDQCLASGAGDQGGVRTPLGAEVLAGRAGGGCARGGARAAASGDHHDSHRARREPDQAPRKPKTSPCTTSTSSTRSRRPGSTRTCRSSRPSSDSISIAAMCERNLDRLLERADQRNNFLWIDMEYSRLRRSDTRAVPPRPRQIAAHRHCPPGLPLSHRERCRIADPARARGADRQGRLSRAAGDRLSEEVRRRRELLPTVRPPDVARGTTRRRLAPHRHPRRGARRPAGHLRAANTRSRHRPSNSRCSTASA